MGWIWNVFYKFMFNSWSLIGAIILWDTGNLRCGAHLVKFGHRKKVFLGL